ncbi:MAG TPA: hypothetical protein VGL59_12095 [Polyangia bacterium]|jgi:hypothetical protein
MTKLILALSLAFAVPMIATSAQAGGNKQDHHCVKDGATLADKTHKECTKEGGKWAKDEPAAAATKAEKDPPAAKTAPPEEKKNPSDPTK